MNRLFNFVFASIYVLMYFLSDKGSLWEATCLISANVFIATGLILDSISRKD